LLLMPGQGARSRCIQRRLGTKRSPRALHPSTAMRVQCGTSRTVFSSLPARARPLSLREHQVVRIAATQSASGVSLRVMNRRWLAALVGLLLALAVAVVAAVVPALRSHQTTITILAAAAGVIAVAVAGIGINVVSAPLVELVWSKRGSTNAVLDRLVRRDAARVQQSLEEILLDGHQRIVRLVGVDPEEIGIHFWLIDEQGKKLFHGRSDARQPMLERVARFRPNRPPNPTNSWAKGHGLVGRVWETAHWERDDLHGLQELTQEQYDDLSAEIRKGRTFEELRRSARDHGAMVGVPVTDTSTFTIRGVVSLNYSKRVALPMETLTSSDVRAVMNEVASDGLRVLVAAGAWRR
jgi:hypothetical protein